MKQTTTPLETEERISWVMRLNALKVNEELPVSFKSTPSMRHAIWKIQNTSDKKFATKKNGSVIKATRLE